jgi:hypothetical protein
MRRAPRWRPGKTVASVTLSTDSGGNIGIFAIGAGVTGAEGPARNVAYSRNPGVPVMCDSHECTVRVREGELHMEVFIYKNGDKSGTEPLAEGTKVGGASNSIDIKISKGSRSFNDSTQYIITIGAKLQAEDRQNSHANGFPTPARYTGKPRDTNDTYTFSI